MDGQGSKADAAHVGAPAPPVGSPEKRQRRYRRPRSRKKWLLVQIAAFLGLLGLASMYYGSVSPPLGQAAPPNLRVGARKLLAFEEMLKARRLGSSDRADVYPPYDATGTDTKLESGDRYEDPNHGKDGVNCTLPTNPLSIVSAIMGDRVCESEKQPTGATECAVCCQSSDAALSPLWLFIVLYTFLGLAIICDDYFCESLDAISDALGLSEDVAGATFMAAGSSAPELFTALVTILITGGSEGASRVAQTTLCAYVCRCVS